MKSEFKNSQYRIEYYPDQLFCFSPIGKDKEKAKLAGLKPHSKYRVTIKATTKPGEGHPYYTDCDTNPLATKPPSEPRYVNILKNNYI